MHGIKPHVIRCNYRLIIGRHINDTRSMHAIPLSRYIVYTTYMMYTVDIMYVMYTMYRGE